MAYKYKFKTPILGHLKIFKPVGGKGDHLLTARLKKNKGAVYKCQSCRKWHYIKVGKWLTLPGAISDRYFVETLIGGIGVDSKKLKFPLLKPLSKW